MISSIGDIVLLLKSFSARLIWRSFKIILSVCCCLLPAVNLSGQTGPGGVGNSTSNRLWLKADLNVFRDLGITPAVDGNPVQQWNDVSGNNNNAIQNTSVNRPVYRINIINNTPALQFSGDTYLDPSALGIPGTGGFSIVTVFKTNSYVAGGMSDGNGDYIMDRATVTNELTSLKIASPNKYGFQKRNDAGNFLGGPVSTTPVSTTSFVLIDYMRDRGVDYRLYLNGSFENSTPDADGNLTPPVPRIGRHATIANGGIKGYIAELMIFNYKINNAQLNIINSYLAAKYGLTIANDKYNYKATHKYEVAGIGRVDAANLHVSATSAGILNISDPSGLDDGDYLLVGHDNGSITSWNNEAPSAIAKIPREWRISKTNDVGTTSFTADVSSFPAPPVPVCLKYVLLVDADGDFSAGAITYELTSTGPNQYKATGISTIDGNYISIGIRKAPTAAITPDPAQMCTGGSLNMDGNPTGGSGGYTHLWTGNTAPLSSVNTPNPVFATTTAGTYNLTYTVTDNKGCSGNDAVSVTVAPQPAITVPPAGATICSGGTHIMSVTAINGMPSLTYQWQESDDNGGSDAWANASGGSGSTTATYTTPSLIATRYYRVVVSAAGAGCTSTTSGGAAVFVVPDPSIVTHPAGTTACYNSTWPMSVAVNGGTAISYQWQVSPNGLNGWSDVGTNSTDYTTSSITNTRYYRVIISSAASGCTSPVTSNVAAVLLENVAPAITGSIAPTTVQGCAATDATPAVSTVAGLEALGLNISDACTADAGLAVAHSDASSGICPIIVTRTYTISDESGNVANYAQTINVLDQIAPVITGSIPVTTVEGCNAAAVPGAALTTAALESLGLNITDGCTADGSLVVTHTDASSGACPIIITRTYTVTDRCGNASTYDQIINIDDTQEPVVTGTLTAIHVEGCDVGSAPAAMTNVAGLEALDGAIAIADACTPDASLIVTYSDVRVGTCPIVITRTYTVADGCGNSENITQVINIEDTQIPSVTGSLPAVNIEGCNIVSAPAAVTTVAALEALGGITINDACTPDASLIVTSTETTPSGNCPLVATRTYKITDVCGNFVNINQTITVDDTQPPVVTGSLSATNVEGCNIGAIPAAVVTVAGLEALAGGITINDLCTTDPLMTVTHADVQSSLCPVVITRTYTVSDACLNSVNIIHIINLDDTQPPVVTGSLSATFVEGCNAGAAPAAVTTVAGLEALAGGIAIADICTPDASLTVTHSDVVAGTCPIVITRTYTITDGCGNPVSIVHNITVDDTQPPLITGALTSTVVEGCNAGAAPAAMTTVAGLEALAGGITIADACTPDGALTVTHSDAQSGACPIVITRTYTVTDECLNSGTVVQTINIDDTQSPVVTGSLAALTVEGCNIGSVPAAVNTVAAIEALAGGISISDACTPDPALTVSSTDLATGICPRVITRTYTITDACANFVNFNQIINIDDTQPPVVTGSLSGISAEGCDPGSAPAAATTIADLEALPGGIDVSDICTSDPGLRLTHSDSAAGSCPTVITRTYTITDACDNFVNIVQIINVDDTQAPVVTGSLSPATVEGCNAGAAPAAVTTVAALEAMDGGVTVTDACTSDSFLAVTHVDAAAGTCPLIITRTYSVTDDCGNTANIIQLITVDDTLPPVIAGTFLPLAVEGCDAGAVPPGETTAAGLESLSGGITITDGCTPDALLSVTHSDLQSGTCPIIITRTYTITDECGNNADIIQTISINDTQAPAVTGSFSTVTVEGCHIGAAPAPVFTVADLEALPGTISIADACVPDGALVVSYADTSAGTCPIVVKRTYTVKDVCGNIVDIDQIININDTQSPVVTGSLAPTTAEGCDISAAPAAEVSVPGLEALAGGIDISDICTIDASLNVTHADVATGSCPMIVTRTYTITDPCDNFVTISQIITVEDTTSPLVTGSLSTTTIEGCTQGEAPAAVATVADLEAMAGGLTISDACTPDAGLTVSHTDAIAGTCPIVITRTYTVTDECGNSENIVHTIRVNDSTDPVITGALTDLTVEGCDTGDAPAAETTVAGLEALAGSISVSDACTSDAALTVSHSDVSSGSCPLIITRTYTITDACSNSVNIIHTINIDDTQQPLVSGSFTGLDVEGCGIGAAPSPAATVAELEMLPGGVTIADVCSPDASLVVTHSDAVTGSCPIIITRTYTVTDECGNYTDIIQIINIDDTQSPVVTGSLDTTTIEGCDAAAAPAAVTEVSELEGLPGGVTIADDCTPDVSLVVTHSDVATGSCPIVITRTYTITDGCGNAANIVHTLNVTDTQSPVISGSLSVTTVEGCNAAVAPAAVTTVAGLESLAGGISITDLCTPDASLVVGYSDVQTGTCPIVITRTYTVTDECGNSENIVHTIRVNDSTDPVITGALTDLTVEGCDTGDAPAAETTVVGLEALAGSISVSDACTSDAALTVSHSDVSSGSCPLIITRTYTITDACNNSVNIIHTINVDDTQQPLVSGSFTGLDVEGCGIGAAPSPAATVAELEMLPGGVTIADACSPDASLVVTHSDAVTGNCPIVITRTYTVTDECGNYTDIIQTINIDDTQSPVVTGSLDTTTIEGCDAAAAPAAATEVSELEGLPGGVSVTDGCTPDAALTVTHTDAVAGICPTIITRTYTITDECGNTVNTVHIINVADTQPPVVSGSLSATTVEGCNAGAAPAAVNSVAGLEGLAGGIAITDICTPDANLTVGYSDIQNSSCPIVITRTYTVTDVCGNTTNIVHIINVDDTTAPTFTVPADITIFKDAACVYDASLSITGDMTDQADNCDAAPDASFTDIVTNGTCIGEQIVTRIWRLVDNCGNTATHNQIITVRDNIPPSFTVPADITIYKDAACAFNSAAAITGDVTDESDNCDTTLEATYIDSVADGVCTGEQIITRTWSLTDDCGNLTTHIQIITVSDNTAPSFTAPADTYVCRNSDCSYVITPLITGDVVDENDNCSTGLIATYTDDISGAADCDKAGIVLRRWSLADACGNSAADQIQTIYINPIPSVIITNSDALFCHTGESADFSINTSNTMTAGSTWQYDVSVTYPAGVTGNWAAGLTNQTVNALSDNLTNNTNIVQTVTYTFTPHIKPGNAGTDCGNGVPVTLSFDLDPQPKIAVTTDPLLCHDGDAVFNISTSNATLHSGSQWRYDVSVSYPAGVTGDWASGLTDQTLNTLTDNLTNTSDLLQTVTYTFTPHIRPGDGGSECNGGVEVILTVDLDPQPKIAVTTDALLCHDGDATFNISTVNTTLHAGSQWRYDVSVAYPAGVTGSWTAGLTDQAAESLTDDLTNTTDLVQTVTYTFTPHIRPGDAGTECQNGLPVIITLDLDPQPKIAVTTDQLQCYDGDATFSISTVNTALHAGSLWSYDVSVTYPAGVTGSWAAGLTDQTANSLTDNLTNNTSIVQTVTYTFTPKIKPGDGGTECGNGLPVIISVDLDPQPRITVATDPLVCFDGDATFNISTVNATLHGGSLWRYDVSVAYPAGVTGSWTAGLIDQTAGSLTDNLTNSTDIVQTVTYTFTPHIRPGDGGTECQAGVPVIISVDLDPQPRMAVTTDMLLCFDGDATFNISTVNSTLHTGSQWRYDVSVIYPAGVTGSWTSGLTGQTANTLTDNLTNNTNVVQTINYTFTPHINPGDGGAECQNGVPASLTVYLDPRPRITVTTDPVLCYDGDATFNISNVHTILGPGSQWRYDVSVAYPAGVTGSWAAGLTDQTGNTLTDNLTNTTDLQQTVTYTFTPHIRPGDGGSECQSGVEVVITVGLDPQPKITVTTDALICHDGDAEFNISTVNTVLNAGSQWRYDVSVVYPAGVTGNWLAGLTDQTLTMLTDNLTNSTDLVQIVTYTFTPHIRPGDGGSECQNGVPLVISVELDPQPKIAVTTDPLLCYDGDATFNVSTVNATLHTGSEWRYDISVVYPAGVTGNWATGLMNQTANTLTDNLTNNTDLLQTVVYTFTPHIRPGDSGSECHNGVPVIITVDLDPQPKITVTTDPLLCYDGDATFNISTVNATLHGASLWRYDVNVVYPAGVTGSWAAGLTDQTAGSLTDNLTNNTDVVQTVTYTFIPHIRPGDAGTECQNGEQVIISVDLDPQPKIAVATDMLLCYDGDAVFNISTVNSTLHAGSQWRYDVSAIYPAGVTGSWTAGLTNQTLNALTDNLTNNTNNVQTVSYTFTPHIKPGDGGAECGNGVPFNVTVYLDPRPKINVATDQLLCYDGDAVFNISNVHTLLGPGSQWRYDVSVSYPAGVTGDWASGLTDQTLNTLTDNLTNTSDLLQTVTYTFTPHIRPGDGGSECNGGVAVIITVDLDPQPKIAVTTDALLCYDGDATFNIGTVNTTLHAGSLWRYDVSVSYPAGVTGSWGAGLTDQTVNTLTDNLTNTTDLVQTVTYTFTPHIRPGDGGSECQNGVAVIITVDLDPQPKIAVTTDQLLCYDGDATFNISTVNAALHASSEWRYDVSVAYPAGVTGSWAAGLTDQTANSITDNLTNNTDIVQTVTYTFTPHIRPGDSGSECHSGVPVIITVDLDPQPKIAVTTDDLLCYDGDATFNISTVNTTLHGSSQWRYDVSVSYPAGVTGSWAAGLTDQTANSLTDNLTNTTDVVQTVTYTFTPHIMPGDGGPECQSGVPLIVTVHLDPQPKITVVTNPVLCYDGDATFNISTVNTTLYTASLWRYDMNVVYPAGVTGSWAAGLTDRTENSITDNLTNTGDVVQTVVYTFTPHIRPGDGGSECRNGVQVIVNVLIDPQPRLFPIPPNTIQCDSILTNIVLQSPNVFSSGFITFDQSVSGDGTISGYSTVPVNGLPDNHVIADRLVNLTDAYHAITYRIVPVSPTGCSSGAAVDISVTVNPTPRVVSLNPNLKRDSSICYGGTTRVTLTSPTVMTSGSIRFDYNVNLTGGGTLTGNSAPEVDRLPGYVISYPYLNSSDTLQSVYYNITPKVDNAICVPGRTVNSEIKVHARPLQSLVIATPLTCNGGSDAELQAIPSKGAGLYYFDWIRPGTDHIFGYGIDRLANIKGGRWEVTVTDNLGCSNSSFVIVAGAYFDSYLYVVDTTGFGTTCNGSNDGEIWIKEKSSSTGIPPFEYWVVRNEQDTVVHSTLPATEVLEKWNNLLPGTYRLIMTDANHCVNLNYPEADITEPDKIEVTLFSPQTPEGFNITCKGYNDGSASVSAGPTGGNGGYKYKWTTSDGLITGPDTLDTLDDLVAGTYYIQITDRKGCIGIDSITLTEPDGMVLTGNELHFAFDGVYNISCQGGSDGSIKLTISGGSGNYTYLWNGPGGYTANQRDISGLAAGTYVCTVTDINGCILTPSPSFNLTEPPPLTITSVLSSSANGVYNINCSGGTGSVDITIAGGIPGTYQYSWSTSDGSGLIALQEDQPSLTAGTYHLKVTDLNNCEQTIDITLTQPDPVSINFSVNNITCQAAGFDNGSIDLTVSGGASPYIFLWSDGSSSEDLSGLTEGYYRVTVTDANGCSKTDSARVNLPPPLTYSKSIADYNGYQISCNGIADGRITINPTNGEPPYNYIWSGPGGFSSGANEISGLLTGQYVLTITDNNFCSATETFDLTEPGIIGIAAVTSSSIAGGYNIDCAGSSTGSVEIEVVNTAGTANFFWSDGLTGQARYELAAGDYRVIITDGNGCHADTTITLTEPDSIKLVYQITQPFCPDKPDGQIVLNVTGGVPGAGYSFTWSDASTSNNLSNIPAGRYSVTVSDLNGCMTISSMNVEALNETCLIIPDAISPDANGINDFWNIGLIELYPEVEITIYNRWGESIWKSARGYPQPWDGRSNGRDLPIDSYHYIIDLNNGSKPIIGNVTIVR